MDITQMLRHALDTSFFLVFAAFAAGAGYLYLERDRVPEEYRTPLRVSSIYLAIAALNYFYMKDIYSPANGSFPTAYRYVDWLLTTPLMLLKFPLLLGVGASGIRFMLRLVALDFVMIFTGLIGEVVPGIPAVHYGMFLIGCFAWLLIVVSMVMALGELPAKISQATRRAVRTMSLFIVIGWAIYPLGYMAPILQLPFEVRELVYNVADFANKLGLCLVVYAAAKQTAVERSGVVAEPVAQKGRSRVRDAAADDVDEGAWLPAPER